MHGWLVGCVFFFLINVDLAIFQPYLDLEAGYNQSLKILSGEAGNRTPLLLLRKPRALKPLGNRCSLLMHEMQKLKRSLNLKKTLFAF